MAKALRVIGQIAAGVALVAGTIATGGGLGIVATAGLATVGKIAAVASVTAAVANTAAQLTQPKPIARGSPANVIIEVEPPRPYIVGRVMTGGVLRYDNAYGAPVARVENPYRWQVRVLSGVGRINGVVGEFFDFQPLGGFYTGFFATTQNLGDRPQATALVPPYGPAPGWDASSRLSGCAAVGLNFLFDKDGERFASGLPIYTALVDGEFAYDPRQDSTFPGGSGPCRLGQESTYVFTRNPALHTGTYAYGRFQNGKRLFGLGLSADAIDWPAIVDWANDCDANQWTANGVLLEGGTGADLREQRVRNLDDLCAAGGCRWFQAGGQLSFDWHRPRIALATLRDEDILEAGGGTDAVQTVRDRMNGVRPQYIEPANNWQQVTAAEIVGTTYRAEDGTELTQVYPLNFVTDKVQAGQLASYAMADSRELGPMDIEASAKWRFYRPGDCLQIDSSLVAYQGQAVINQRALDPASLSVSLSLKSETPGKHDFALGKVAVPPPSPVLAQTAEERDLVASSAMRPREIDAEFGSTNGATIVSPGAFDPVGGVVGNVRDESGAVRNPGELLNSEMQLTPSGLLQFRPLPDLAPIPLGKIELPDLGAASEAAIRQAQDDTDRLATALATALDEASRTRETFTSAGFYVDEATGQVRISAVEQTAERVSSAEIRLNAAEANINLRATVNYVDQAIANAVLDPSQIADLDAVFVRLTAAELDIDGLNATVTTLATATELSLVSGRVTAAEQAIDALEGTITTKVDTTTFNALDTRVTNAESTLTALGDTASIVNQVRSVRLIEREADANAENTLLGLLQGDRNRRDEVAAIADARQELRTDIREGLQAEAVARLALQVRVGQAEASLATESLTRANADSALSQQITQLTANTNNSLGALSAAITAEQQARVSADGALAQSVSNLSTTVNGNTASIQTVQQSVNGFSVRFGVRLDVNGRVTGFVANNDGVQGNMEVVADSFRIFAPGMGSAVAPFEFSGGNLRLSGNLRVGGNIIVDGSINAAKIEANGVTRAYEAKNPGPIFLSVVDNIVTIPVVMDRPGTIILIANYQFSNVGPQSWFAEIAVDSTPLQTGSGNIDNYASFAGTFFASTPGTYIARARAGGPSTTTIAQGGCSLVVLRTYV